MKLESWMGVPIIAADEVIGVLAMEAVEAYAFDRETSAC